MIYFQYIFLILSILVGVLGVYNKKVKNKDYQEDTFTILALAIFYSINSEEVIVSWLLFVLAIIILFIMIDKIINRVNLNKK